MLLPDQIEDIANKLNEGLITLLPTESLWGLSCDAYNTESIAKISQLKDRKEGHPYVLLVSSIEMLNTYIELMHPRVETLLSLHRKPLTLIHTAKNLPDHLITQDDTVAIRVTQNPICKGIIEVLERPIVSTSANVSGQDVPIYFNEIDQIIKDGVDFIPTYPNTVINRKLEMASVIASYDSDGELDFIRL